MPDYFKCCDTDCPMRFSCARYRMVAGRWQTRFMESPREDDGECKFYVPDYMAPYELHETDEADRLNMKGTTDE